jgi:hypothetical protein
MEDEETREKLAGKAIKTAEEHQLKNIGRQYQEVYDEFLGEK